MHGFVASLGAVPVAIDPDGPRPARRADEPPAARARQPARQPGGRRADRGPRPARRRRRLAARHDARRRREPADLGRHLPRQRAGAARGARRAPPPRRAARAGARRAATGATSRRWIAEASREPPAHARRGVPRPGRAPARRRPRPDRPGVLAGITQALGAERINIEDFELRHFSPERGGMLTMLVSGAGEAARAAALLEAQGYGVSVSPVLASEGRAGVVGPGRRRRAGRQVDLAPRGPARRGRRGRERSSAASAAPADTESTVAAVRALGVQVDEDGDTVRSRASACAACARRRGRSTAATPARSRGCCRGLLAGQRRPPVRADRRRVAQLAARCGGSPIPLMRDGRGRRDDRRPAARSRSRARRLRPIRYELPVASAQVKSCVLLAGLSRRRPDDGRRAGADARPHRADAAGRGRAGRVASRGGVEVWPADAAASRFDLDVPGDFSSAAPFVVAATLLARLAPPAPRRRRQPDAHRAARRARADGRPHRALQPVGVRRRAGRRHRGASTPTSSRPRSSRTRCRG